jgi:hypothetical protein
MDDDKAAKRHKDLRQALQTLTHGSGVQRANLLEALNGELRVLQECWSVNLKNGLDVAQKTVSLNIHAYISKLAPRPAKQPLSRKGRERQYRHAIDVCFHATKRPELEGKDLTQRRVWLDREAPSPLKIDDRTCRRDLEHALDQIAQQILDAEDEAARKSSELDDVAEGQSDVSTQLQVSVIEPTEIDPADRTLASIYQRYIERLARDEPESLQLLELLPFITHQFIPPEYLMAYLLGVPYIKRDQLARAQLAYEAAIRPLEGYSLITADKELGVSIDVATQNVLRPILADRLTTVVMRMKNFLSVDRKDLYAEGWSALTVAGREACNRVLTTHIQDRYFQNGALTAQGIIGGKQWGMLVTQLWIRHMKLEFMNLLVEGVITRNAPRIDWVAFMQDITRREQMQIDEMRGVIRIYDTLVPSRESDDGPEANAAVTPEEIAEQLVENIMLVTRRYQDSIVGQLDLRIVNGQVLDPSQEDEARELLREMARQAFRDKDEGQKPHTA